MFKRDTGAMHSKPDFTYEKQLNVEGYDIIAGIDEAGRGPLAGPVTAAAVILPRHLTQAQIDALSGLTDSKQLSEKNRDRLFAAILDVADHIAIASICAETIDHCNIRQATLIAMQTAAHSLAIMPDAALIDGRDVPADLAPIYGRALIKGDALSLSIAAASVVAKVTRDRMLNQMGSEHPDYGFENHSGYGSLAHRTKIQTMGGVQRFHRYTFRPLRASE